MSKRAQPAVVGTFVVVGLGVIVAAALLFGSGRMSKDTLTLVSFFEGDVSGLAAGAPVTFRGVNIGSVQELLLTLPDDPREVQDVRIAVLYNLDIARINAVSPGMRVDVTDPVQFEDLIQAGFRVELKSGNLLTGGKSLSMDFRPEVPDTRLTGVELPYPEVPTIPSGFTEVQARLTAFALKVSELPVDSVVTNLNGLITDFRELVANPETQELPGTINETLVAFSEAAAGFTNLVSEFEGKGDEVTAGIEETFEAAQSVLVSLDSTLVQIRAQTDSDSPLAFRLMTLLEEMEMTARSMRELVNYLENNPSALLRGRGGGGDDR
jgi:paraquat-inducible protein B